MKKILPYGAMPLLLVLIFTGMLSTEGYASPITSIRYSLLTDTIPVSDTADTTGQDTLYTNLAGFSNYSPSLLLGNDTLPLQTLSTYSYTSLQQYIKGNIAGVYVQTTSGEPGTDENMYIRGLSQPVLSPKDLYAVQPAVYLNGIPLIDDNPFVYDIQKYNFDPLGPATNLLSAIDLDNVQSVEVLKGADAVALLGPRAANGAVMITTKNAKAGEKQISINSYYGFVQQTDVEPVNAAYIAKVRKGFYDKYATSREIENYPEYLANSSDPNYYGPANWTDLYYRNTFIHSVNGSLTGGSERANFRFFAGETQGSSDADGAKLNRYKASFFINMLPLPWLTASAMLNATRLERNRNTSLRDRFSETNYLPDLTYPLPPNKEAYQIYLDEYDKAFDRNKTNSIQGSFALKAILARFELSSRLGFDYNEGQRDVFWPSTLLEGNNYTSNYFGYNQRVVWDNMIHYRDTINTVHELSLEIGQSLQADLSRYNYGYAYKGPSDFIKMNVVEGDPNKSNYLVPQGFIAYRYLDNIKGRLLSFYGRVNYTYNGILSLSAIVRSDGSSYAQPESRWFVSPTFSARWNISKNFFPNSAMVNALALKATWGRVGSLFVDDGIGAGPQYRVDLGWSNEPRVSSYDGVATLSRPYNYGWVGYNIKWPYIENTGLSIDGAFLNDRLHAELNLYTRNSRRMLIPVPAIASSGFSNDYQQGMSVNNQGIEFSLNTDIIKKHANSVTWNAGFNISYNKNELKALPGGLQSIIIGDRKLAVGHGIDQYWLLNNEGIYNNDGDVPANPETGAPMTYKGIELHAGDPKWQDTNGDYVIDDEDKKLMGHILPQVTGGFNSNLKWKGISFSFDLYFALDREILNEQAANKLDFVNTESANNMRTVTLKEITFWKKTFDPTDYPMYNPWSDVMPYQEEQSLFLQNGAFLKVHSVSLAYDFSRTRWFKKSKSGFSKLYLYVTANNLFTLTPYKGFDPELVNYLGYDTGYGLPLPKSFAIGIKVDF